MSWDPTIVATIYENDDYYDVSANKEVEKSVNKTRCSLVQNEEKLSLYKPVFPNIMNKDIIKGKIQEIEEIKFDIEWIGKAFKSLTNSIKGFEKNLASEISLINNMLINLNAACETYLAYYRERLSTQTLNFNDLTINSTSSSEEVNEAKFQEELEMKKPLEKIS